MTSIRKPLVLVAEDQAVVALTFEEILADEDYEVAGPFRSCAEIDHWLAQHTPDCALMDIRLADGECHPQAAELRKRGVPVVIVSGVPEHSVEGFVYDVWLGKPLSFEDLVSTLRLLTTKKAASAPLRSTAAADS